ncbi:MAG: polysaccharide biosynthesis protein [Lachnospiraceae bacterium]|nr:polysaccharide biosynthesis protein [Lachnospiraceae bacterium]
MSPAGRNQNNYLVHGGILAVASVLVRLIGMIYRVPMANIIGSEGSGYYAHAYSVYNILLLLSSYSLPLAVSKMVSARVSAGRWRETGRVLTVAMLFGTAIGAVFGLICWFGADFFCTKVLNAPMAAVPLRWMAPTVFIMAVLGVLRGFYQGFQTTIPTAISQILEQIVNAFVSVGMAAVLFQYGTELSASTGVREYAAAFGAAGGTIGTGAGALTALLFCAVVFFFFLKRLTANIRNDGHTKVRTYQKLFTILMATAVPVILSTAAYNCIDLIDAGIFNAHMAGRGFAAEAYSATWGDYSNAFLLLVHLPVALAAAIASALVPSLTASFSAHDERETLSKISLTVRITLVLAIPCAFGMMTIGGNLASLLFSSIDDEARLYLAVGGIAIIFYSLSTVTNAILQGINEMGRPVLHALISLVAHTALLVLLLYVFKIGIFAVIVSYVLFSLVMSVLNLVSIYRLTGYRMDPIRAIAIPAGLSLIVVLICFLVSFITTRFLTGNRANLVIVLVSVVLGAAVYFIGILYSGVFTRKQLEQLPFGKHIAAISDRLHLSGQ